MLDDSSEVPFARELSPETLERVLLSLPGAGSETSSKAEVAGDINSVFPIAADGRIATVLHMGVSGEYVRGRLVGWRVLSGIGYGLIFIAAQAWVATTPTRATVPRA